MTLDLKGKTILVTGGNGGIGLGMAQGLGQAGADLVVWGSTTKRLGGGRRCAPPTINAWNVVAPQAGTGVSRAPEYRGGACSWVPGSRRSLSSGRPKAGPVGRAPQ
jgi:NAD(P)-dependent dehydrogenase (short-subunit alcohol dehydrogenase family)